MSVDKTFKEAKKYIVEGLSMRLVPFEETQVQNLKISLNPRDNYAVQEPVEITKAREEAKKREAGFDGFGLTMQQRHAADMHQGVFRPQATGFGNKKANELLEA